MQGPNRTFRGREWLALAAAALLAWLAAGCAVNPATGKKEFSLVTPAQEAAIGREGYGATIAEYGQYDDSNLGAYVDSVGRRVAAASEEPTLPWRFTVLDDPVVNAFAMPGGYIYVTRGLLAHMQSEAQLAGVLGHEIGHVTARHTAKQITQQQIAGLGLGLASAVSPTFARYSSVAQQGLGLLMLKYSRDDETQADELGVRYATASGYDPREIPGTYHTLQRIAERSGQSLPNYMSTHPDPGQREVRTSDLAAKAAAGRTNMNVRQRVYLDHVRNLVYGDNPRYGWFEGSRFYHPVLGLEMSFPPGWKTQHTHTALTGQSADQQGVMQMTLAQGAAGKTPGDYLVGLTTTGKISGSRGAPETLGNWAAWIGAITVADGQGGQQGLVAGFVSITSDVMLQVLGKGASPGDANERAILASIRTMTVLTDPKRGMIQPARIHVQPAPVAGDFRSVYGQLSGGLVPVEEAAIVNGVELDEAVLKGQWLKLPEAVKRP
jgi:predicted Zn-dependent protease